jgi:hypothetical protein
MNITIGNKFFKFTTPEELYTLIFKEFHQKQPELFNNVINQSTKSKSLLITLKGKFGNNVPYNLQVSDEFIDEWKNIIDNLKKTYEKYDIKESVFYDVNLNDDELPSINVAIGGKKGVFIEEGTLQYYHLMSYRSLVKEKNKRDLGKSLADANEYIQRDYLNKISPIKFMRREEYMNEKNMVDKNGMSWDLISVDKNVTITAQSKFRGSQLHLEQTRRSSEKNKDAYVNGHVRYSLGESDFYFFTLPHDEYETHENWEYIAIPEKALEDPEKPGYLVSSVSMDIQNKYRGRVREVIETIYKDKMLITEVI